MYWNLNSLKNILAKNEEAHKKELPGEVLLRTIEGVKTSSNHVLRISVMFSEILDDEGINDLISKLNYLNDLSISKVGTGFIQEFWTKLLEVKNKDELMLLTFEIYKIYENSFDFL